MGMQRKIKNQVVQEYRATGEDGAELELVITGPSGLGGDVVKVVMTPGDVATLRFHNLPRVHQIIVTKEAHA